MSSSTDSMKESRIGYETYSLYLFFYLVFSFLILVVYRSYENFPDFHNYTQYIKSEAYFLRFRIEPISVLIMSISSKMKIGGGGYYVLTWLLASFLMMLIPLRYGRRYLCFVTFVLLNPISLILYQTPRQFISFSIFVLSMFLIGKVKYIGIFFAMLAHTISGFLTLFFSNVIHYRAIKLFSAILIAMVGFMLMSLTKYSVYFEESSIQRGVGRYLYVIVFLSVTLILSAKKSLNNISFVLCMLFLTLLFYAYTSYAGRIMPYICAVLAYYVFNNFKSKQYIIVVHAFMIFSLLFSLGIIVAGMYGYG